VPATAALRAAGRPLELETEGLKALRAALDRGLGEAFGAAVVMLAAATGRLIVTGIGKSGLVGQKVAATFASTGTPAFFVHPSEASHGDLGMITRDDAILALSWGGEAVELHNIVTYSRRFHVPLVAPTRPGSRCRWSPSPRAPAPPSPSGPTWCWSCRAPGRPVRTASRPPPPRPCSSPSATASPSPSWSTAASPPRTSRSFTPAGRW